MNKKINLTPAQIIALGFLIVILTGALLLMLPASSASGTSTNFIDCLFTATSATCITGLVTLETAAHWSLLGKIVIILLIQIGGLGFMSVVSLIFIIFKQKMSLSQSAILQESLNLNSKEGLLPFVGYILKFTLVTESIGALLLTFVFVPEYGWVGLWYSIFHSISAFCNAGFDILGSTSLEAYYNNPLLLFTIMGLIVSGGLGFTVWLEIIRAVKKMVCNKFSFGYCVKRMSLHSKIAIIATALLIISGTAVFYLLEFNNPLTLGRMNEPHKLISAMFQSVTLRTAGFAGINQGNLTDGSKLAAVIYMLIGGSPAGTAGGIKTVTIGVILLAVVSIVRGKDCIVAFNRSISLYTLQKALAVMVMILAATITATILLSITESGVQVIDLLFEAASAIATVGLSANVTPTLSTLGRIIIILLMYIGRIGPISMAVAIIANKDGEKHVKYLEEDIIVG